MSNARINNIIKTDEASSFVKHIAYDRTTRVFEIQTQENRYRYYNVPASIFVEVVTSPSVGNSYNTFVKGQFKSRKFKVKT